MSKSLDTHPQSRAWGLFLLGHTVLLERIEAELAAAGLPPLAWYDVLWELEKADQARLRMHELADRIVLPRYHLTRLADRIEQARLIKREDCAEDRRGYYLKLTAAGVETRKAMWKIYTSQIETLFVRHLSDAAAREWVERLTQMIRGAREREPEAAPLRSAKRARRAVDP